MFRGVIPLTDLDDGICPPGGISVAYQGDEKGKLFAFRETATGIVTFTAMAVFSEDDAKHISGQEKSSNSSLPTDKKELLRIVFGGFPPSVHHVIDRVPSSSIFVNAVYDIDVMEEWSRGPVILVGDAAHAMTPGMGQGANQGLEDACELAHCLSKIVVDDSATFESTKAITESLVSFWRQRIDPVSVIGAILHRR